MKNYKMQFSEDLQNFILKGAIVVYSNVGSDNATILIRLPKGEFYKTEDADLGKREFEYLQFEQDANMSMYHSVSRNETKSNVVKLASKDHYTNGYYIRKRNKKSTK